MLRKGTFFVLSGPSGSGKGTVLEKVLTNNPELIYSVSATSRKPRKGEEQGKNYFFLSRDEFEKKICEKAFLEYTETYGNYYGTLKSQVENALVAGKNIILEIDPVGARNIRFSYPDAVLIFLVAPSLEILKARLTWRGSEDDKSLKTRLNAAVSEMENACLYDYVVVNDNVDSAADDVQAVIRAENLKSKNCMEIISRIKGGNNI